MAPHGLALDQLHARAESLPSGFHLTLEEGMGTG